MELTVEGAKPQPTTQSAAQPVAQPFVEDSLRKLLQLQQDLLERSKVSSKIPYRWQDSKPPAYYHPLPWLRSLDDTPAELFRSTQRKNVDLRTRITKYFDDFNKKNGGKGPEPPAWDMKNIIQKLPPKDLSFLSFYDFRLDEEDLDFWRYGRSADSLIDESFVHSDEPNDGSGRVNKDAHDTLDKTWSEYFNSHIWSWLLDDTEEVTASPSLQKLAAGVKRQLLDSKFRKKFSEEYQRSLLEDLTDSVSTHN